MVASGELYFLLFVIDKLGRVLYHRQTMLDDHKHHLPGIGATLRNWIETGNNPNGNTTAFWAGVL
jgi:hypothetical protein